MRKKIKRYNLGGIPFGADQAQLFQFLQNQTENAGSGMGGVHNEFDQVRSVVNKIDPLVNFGKQAVETARGIKNAKAIAESSAGVGDLLGTLGSGTTSAAPKGFADFLSSGAGGAATAGVGLLGKVIQEVDKKDGNYSNAGAMGGGALQGAALGSALGPAGTVVGGAVGAGIGLLQKNKFEANARAQKLTEEYNEIKKDTRRKLEGRQILNTFPVEGIKDQIYKYGGKTIPPEALNPELAAMVSSMTPRQDRLTSYTPQQSQALKNQALANQSNQAVAQGVSNVYNFHKDKPLDAVGMDLAMLGQFPILGNAADLANAALSGGRSAYSYMTGDTAKASEQAALAGLSATAAIPGFGSIAGANRLARTANHLAHDAHTLEKGVIAAKGLKAGHHNKKAYGGMAQPDYLAEGGEMIQHAPGDLPRTNQNGAVTPITQTIARITGDKHSAPSGGVGMTGEKPARIYSDQLHVPEDLMNQLSKL